jgi:pyruvate/2-oxoglutarate dehydrogenase complex dihydrolipoamide acyltransferase (E2) component
VRRKRIVDSDDSDDAPASRPSVAVAPSSSDTPTAASPASNASAKKPRVSISSSRVSAAAAGAAAASTVDESGAGAQVVDELLESKSVVDVACVTAAAAAAAAASESSAPAKSGLKIGNPSVPSCLCLPVASHPLSQRLNVASAATKCVDLVEGFCCCGHIVEPSFLPTKASVTSARMIGRRPKALMRIAFTTLRRITAQTIGPRVSRTLMLSFPRLVWRVLLQLLWGAA